MELDRARKTLARATALLKSKGGLLGETERQQIAEGHERLRVFLASLGSEMRGPQLAAVIADSKEAEALLGDALIALEERLGMVERQLEELQKDHGKLLLRQMASQTENKLARLATPGLAPKSAVHMTINRLSKGRDKGVDKQKFKDFVDRYPQLQDGLESLKDMGTTVAHPEMARVPDGSKQPVTDTVLQDLINTEYAEDDPVKPDVQQVLSCLTALAAELGESLFVPTM